MISTHVLDTARGVPATRLSVELDVFITGHGWVEVGRGITSEQGRVEEFGEPESQGLYRLMFDVASYMPHAFFPSISVTFEVRDPGARFHVPILLSQFSYTTYRES
jgi:5-hydroxyisourate hydrolase